MDLQKRWDVVIGGEQAEMPGEEWVKLPLKPLEPEQALKLARQTLEECEKLAHRVVELEEALKLAYTALTEGVADVPAEERSSKCAKLRAEAKRVIREVLQIDTNSRSCEGATPSRSKS